MMKWWRPIERYSRKEERLSGDLSPQVNKKKSGCWKRFFLDEEEGGVGGGGVVVVK